MNMKQEIDKIYSYLTQVNNIAFCLGHLTPTQIKRLEKHFKVTREPFGYWKFEKANKEGGRTDEMATV